jgi:hypothetical protein
MALARVLGSEHFDVVSIRKLEDPEPWFGVHQLQAEDCFVEVRQSLRMHRSRTEPAEASDIHP